MQEINKKSAGLATGALLGFFHLCWLVLVALGVAKPLLNWVLSLHHISLAYSIDAFSAGRGLELVILTFVIGYVLGWVFAAFWNALRR